jgi:hypothetical protein
LLSAKQPSKPEVLDGGAMNLAHPLNLLVVPYVLPAAMMTYAAWAMYLAAPTCLRYDLRHQERLHHRRG